MRAIVGYPPLLAACLVRATIVWAGIRVLALLGGIATSGSGTIAIALFVCAIVMIDARVTRELIYIRNLGLPGSWLALWTGAHALLLEATVPVMFETIMRVLW